MTGIYKPVAIALAVAFALASVFHVVGAFGVLDGLPVIPVEPGQPYGTARPLSWLFVAAALAVATMVVLARADLILTSLPPRLSTLACAMLGTVFVLRAIGDFRWFGLFRQVGGTDFAFWDARFYTPLVLVLGIGALWLATTRRSR